MHYQERDKFAEWKGEIAQRCGNGVRRGSLLTMHHTTTHTVDEINILAQK